MMRIGKRLSSTTSEEVKHFNIWSVSYMRPQVSMLIQRRWICSNRTGLLIVFLEARTPHLFRRGLEEELIFVSFLKRARCK